MLACVAEWAERGRDLSAKDLMSSIFQAANRRMRRGKGQSKSNDSIEIDPDSESSYNERNIDHEIEMQRLRDLQPPSSITPGMLTRESSSGRFDSLSSSQSMSPSASLQDTKEVGLTPGDAKKPPVPPTYEEHQQMQRQRAAFDAPVAKPVATLSPLMPIARPLGGSNPQSPCCAVTRYPAYPGSELTPLSTADDIKPTVLRRYSVDELGDVVKCHPESDADKMRSTDAAMLQQRKCARERALQRTKEILEQDDNLDDLLSQPRDFFVAKNMDTLSVTSDYSTMSSSHTTSEHKAPAAHRGNVYSIDLAPTSGRDALQSQSCSNLHPAGGSQVWPPSDKYAKHSPQDGVVSHPTSKSGEKRVELAAADEGVPRRHGSLDSLIYRVDCATRTTAGGVDGNEDFLESITATLDHKLELIAPSPPSRVHASDGSAQNCVDGVVYDRPFRNPSLHRTLQPGVEGQGDRSPSGSEDVCAYSDAIRKSTEQLYGSRDDLIEHKMDGGAPVEMLLKRKARSPSPPSARRRRDAADLRRIKRRHTVGGSNDLEHFKALMQVCQSNVAEQKPSAWERLQPQRSPPGGGPPDLKTWLVQQHHLRHVGSSPALFSGAPLLSERGQSPDATRLSSKGWRHRTGFSRSASTGEELSSSPVSPPGGCAGSFTFESEV